MKKVHWGQAAVFFILGALFGRFILGLVQGGLGMATNK